MDYEEILFVEILFVKQKNGIMTLNFEAKVRFLFLIP